MCTKHVVQRQQYSLQGAPRHVFCPIYPLLCHNSQRHCSFVPAKAAARKSRWTLFTRLTFSSSHRCVARTFLSNSSSYSAHRLALIMLVNSWTLLQTHNKLLKSSRELRLESYHEAANFKKINSIRVFALSSEMFADIDSTKLTMAAAR
jgi:hypothetical protein